MFAHVTVGVGDLQRAGRFYDAVLAPLGLAAIAVEPDGGPDALAWIIPGERHPKFYAHMPFDGAPPSAGNGAMLAFKAPSTAAVDAAHAAALLHGGTCEGAPGLRPHYEPDYYGAYFRDPDGNKLHAVHRASWFTGSGDLAAA